MSDKLCKLCLKLFSPKENFLKIDLCKVIKNILADQVELPVKFLCCNECALGLLQTEIVLEKLRKAIIRDKDEKTGSKNISPVRKRRSQRNEPRIENDEDDRKEEENGGMSINNATANQSFPAFDTLLVDWKFCCTHCNYISNNPKWYKRHLIYKHQLENPRIYQCLYCEESYQRVNAIRIHFDCVHGNKPRPTRQRRKTIAGDTPLQTRSATTRNLHQNLSSICNQSLDESSDDSSNNPYHFECSFCTYETESVKVFKTHLEIKHQIVDSKIYKCKKCSCAFMLEETLKNHMAFKHDQQKTHSKPKRRKSLMSNSRRKTIPTQHGEESNDSNKSKDEVTVEKEREELSNTSYFDEIECSNKIIMNAQQIGIVDANSDKEQCDEGDIKKEKSDEEINEETVSPIFGNKLNEIVSSSSIEDHGQNNDVELMQEVRNSEKHIYISPQKKAPNQDSTSSSLIENKIEIRRQTDDEDQVNEVQNDKANLIDKNAVTNHQETFLRQINLSSSFNKISNDDREQNDQIEHKEGKTLIKKQAFPTPIKKECDQLSSSSNAIENHGQNGDVQHLKEVKSKDKCASPPLRKRTRNENSSSSILSRCENQDKNCGDEEQDKELQNQSKSKHDDKHSTLQKRLRSRVSSSSSIIDSLHDDEDNVSVSNNANKVDTENSLLTPLKNSRNRSKSSSNLKGTKYQVQGQKEDVEHVKKTTIKENDVISPPLINAVSSLIETKHGDQGQNIIDHIFLTPQKTSPHHMYPNEICTKSEWTFQCSFCSFECNKKKPYKEHMQSEHDLNDENIYKCLFCTESYERYKSLKNHVTEQHCIDLSTPCDTAATYSDSSLHHHSQQQEEPNKQIERKRKRQNFSESIKPTAITEPADLERKQVIKRKKVISCIVCGKIYSTTEKLQAHVKRLHSTDELFLH